MAQTVAARLGETPHLSPLLRKTWRLGLRTPDQLLRLAVKRGCAHYTPPDFDPSAVQDAGRERLPDAELAIALISAAQEYDSQRVRCAAQLLGSPFVSPEVVSRLARMERCEAILAYIAYAALRTDIAERHAHWDRMLERIHPRRKVPAGCLPHPSRFTVQTGVTGPKQSGGPRMVWLRPAVRSPDER